MNYSGIFYMPGCFETWFYPVKFSFYLVIFDWGQFLPCRGYLRMFSDSCHSWGVVVTSEGLLLVSSG